MSQCLCGEPLCSDPTSEAQRNKRQYSLPELTQIIQRRAGIDLQYEETNFIALLIVS